MHVAIKTAHSVPAGEHLQTVLSIRRQPVGGTLHQVDGFSRQTPKSRVNPLHLPVSSPAHPCFSIDSISTFRLLGIIYHQILSRCKPSSFWLAIQKRKVLATSTTALRSQEAVPRLTGLRWLLGRLKASAIAHAISYLVICSLPDQWKVPLMDGS